MFVGTMMAYISISVYRLKDDFEFKKQPINTLFKNLPKINESLL